VNRADESGLQAGSPSLHHLARASTATATVRHAATVHSSRSTQAVDDLRERLKDYGDSPVVADFLALAATLYPTES